MTTLWPEGHPIAVTLDPQGTPTAFVWQARRHAVAQIVQRWDVDNDWWRGDERIWRDYLALITQDNLLCVIYHDRLTDTWRLARLYD